MTDDEIKIRNRIIELAKEYGRYGYKRITALLWQEGFIANKKRVERIWREEDLKVQLILHSIKIEDDISKPTL